MADGSRRRQRPRRAVHADHDVRRSDARCACRQRRREHDDPAGRERSRARRRRDVPADRSARHAATDDRLHVGQRRAVAHSDWSRARVALRAGARYVRSVQQGGKASLARIAITAALVLAGCYVGARLDTWLVFPGVGAAILFLPYAIVTAALLRTPRRYWWIVFLAATAGDVLPHYLGGKSIAFALLAELINDGRSLIAAVGFSRFCRSGRVQTMREMIA